MQETLFDIPIPVLKNCPSLDAFHEIRPLEDSRWERLVRTHPLASVFHSQSWLDALRRTYGYEPVAYSTTAPGENLRNALVFCRVESRYTGRRLVSLPFSDHCDPLVDQANELKSLVDGVERELHAKQWDYIEMRPLQPFEGVSRLGHPSARYTFHHLDLEPDLDTLLVNCHHSSTQRKIQRAHREGLTYVEGSSDTLLDSFYRLLVITRRRHSVPPQPKLWFRNLRRSFGEALKIRLTLKGKKVVAGMLTIRYKDALVYKYGGSDARFHNLGAMHLLYWESIRDAKNLGLKTFDLGRSDADQVGLIKFKSRWGAQQSTLTYWRYTETGHSDHIFDQSSASWKMRMLKRAFTFIPSQVLPIIGRIIYRHAG